MNNSDPVLDFVRGVGTEISETEIEYSFTLNCKDDWDQLNVVLKKNGISYSKRTSKTFCKSGAVEDMKIRWRQKSIKFFGSPFTIERREYYQCSNGFHYFKNRFQQLNKNPGTKTEKRRFRILPTKKCDCTAKMTCTRVRYFPRFNIEKEVNLNVARRKVIKNLKIAAKMDEKLESAIKYYITLSRTSVHNHLLSESLLNQEVDNRIKAEIKKYVQEGFTATSVIQKMLNEYVKENLSADIPTTCRAFYPSTKAIYNYVVKCNDEMKQNNIKSLDLRSHVRKWNLDTPYIFYRPFASRKDKHKSFLFCYQDDFQKDLLNRYGSAVLLDGVHKISKFRLHFFTLVVKTNSDYMVAGFFITNVKNGSTLAEALEVFRSWNNQWHLSHLIVDFVEPEIETVNMIGCSAFVCSFHRDKGWKRWFQSNKTSAGISDEDGNVCLDYMKKLASADNEVEFNSILECFYDSNAWKNNLFAQKYFSTMWLPQKVKWSRAFLTMDSNYHGIESAHKTMKYPFLRLQQDKDLGDIIDEIINNFLPCQLRRYKINNSKDVSYKNNIPEFLHNRPINFIKHVYKRYTSAKSCSHKSCIILMKHMEKVTYLISSEGDMNVSYEVDFSVPYCTCPDFAKYRYPCKHMFSIMIDIPYINFDKAFPEEYLKNPFITIDEKYSSFDGTLLINLIETNEEESMDPLFSESTEHPVPNYFKNFSLSEQKLGYEIIQCDPGVVSNNTLSTPPTIEIQVMQEENEEQENDDGIEKIRELARNIYNATFLMSESRLNRNHFQNMLYKLEWIKQTIDNNCDINHQ